MPQTLHMIGNAHLDPVWLWRWPEGCAEAIGTCWAAVELLDEQPGMVFTRGEAAVYQWIEDLDPVLFARIRALVSEGRWALANGWWLQPDCNIPDGESFVRHALYGKRYFRHRFGVEVHVGYNVDSFGHAATLPMLLRHTGSDSYVFMRPGPHEKELPGTLFDWVAPDGSRVTTFRIALGYNTGAGDPVAERIVRHEEMAAAAGHPFMCFYGVGNHGGGPTRRDVAEIRAAQASGHDVLFSSPAAYFTAVEGVARPEVRDELQFHAIGCYAAISALKALNRTAEARLAQAEAASALAARDAGAAYPHEALRRLWHSVLFNQFHDIMGGTSVEPATRDAVHTLGGVVQGADEILNAGLRRLAATVAPGPDPADAAFLVFNLTGTTQEMPLEVAPWLNWNNREPRRLLDHTGAEVPYQAVRPEASMRGLQRFLFAPRVPPFGYSMYRFAIGAPAPAAPSALRVEAEGLEGVLENAAWRLEIDAASGGIARLVDKRSGRDVFGAMAHLPVVVEDPSDTWSHGIDRFGLEGAVMVAEALEVVDRGPLRASLGVRSRSGPSTVTSTYMMVDDPGLPIEIRVSIDWRGCHQLLRLRYPLALQAPSFRYEVPAGSLERPADGREWPGQRWVLASGGEGDAGYGVVVANDAKYSYAADGATLHITALRSPVYAHHDPYPLDPTETYAYTDQGEQTFTVRLLAGEGLTARHGHALAGELTRPPAVTPHVTRQGTQAQQASLLSVRARSSVVTWLKGAEDGEGLVLRLLEVEGQPDEAVVTPSGDRYALRPHGIVTLRTDAEGHWHPTNGLEDPVDDRREARCPGRE